MKRALIVVDVQNDFVTGTLAVPEAERIIPTVEAYAADGDYDLVVATRDWHPPGHTSFAEGEPEFRDGSWPVHCVQGTDGAEFAWQVPNGAVIVSKGMRGATEAYSGFDGDPDLLRELNDREVDQVDVVGLALDYCVKATALDAARMEFDTRVLAKATRPVDPECDLTDLAAAGIEYR